MDQELTPEVISEIILQRTKSKLFPSSINQKR